MMQTKSYVTPADNDVLCGRGLTSFRHPGNQILREKIASNVEKYVGSTSHKAKTVLIHEIILSIMKEGGRFLRYDKQADQWFNGGIDAAKNRVGSAFRDASVPGNVKCITQMRASIKRKPSDSKSIVPAPSISAYASSNQEPAHHDTASIPQSPPAEAGHPPPSLQRQVAGCPASLLSLAVPGIESPCFDPIDSDNEGEGGLDDFSASSIVEVLENDDYPADDYYPTEIFVPKK